MGGGAARSEYQSPSLCGLEHYGKSKEKRGFGFSLTSLSEDGEMRVWPYKRVLLAGGEGAFLWDQSFGAQRNEGVLVRPKDQRARPPIVKPPAAAPMPATAAEGVVLHIALVDVYLAEYRRIEIIDFINNQIFEWVESNALGGDLEIIDCTWDGRFTLFLSQSNNQQWSALEQALQISLRLASAIKQWNADRGNEDLGWMPQVGIAIHLEHDGHRLPSCWGGRSDYRLVGDGIDHARAMLPKPARPYILLSGEAFRSLRHLLSDYHTIDGVLHKIPSLSALEGHVQAEIQEFTIVPEDAPATLSREGNGETAYSLCIRTHEGRLLFGDTHLPPKQVRIDQSGQSGDQAFSIAGKC